MQGPTVAAAFGHFFGQQASRQAGRLLSLYRKPRCSAPLRDRSPGERNDLRDPAGRYRQRGDLTARSVGAASRLHQRLPRCRGGSTHGGRHALCCCCQGLPRVPQFDGFGPALAIGWIAQGAAVVTPRQLRSTVPSTSWGSAPPEMPSVPELWAIDGAAWGRSDGLSAAAFASLPAP